jgi:hypothetical protein
MSTEVRPSNPLFSQCTVQHCVDGFVPDPLNGEPTACDACYVRARQEIERLRAALKDAIERLECDHEGNAHYCPNCDNSLDRLRGDLQKALEAAPADETKA